MIHVCRTIIYFSIDQMILQNQTQAAHSHSYLLYLLPRSKGEEARQCLTGYSLCVSSLKKKNKDILHLSLVSWDQIVKILRTGEVGGHKGICPGLSFASQGPWDGVKAAIRAGQAFQAESTAGWFSSIQMKVFHDPWWRFVFSVNLARLWYPVISTNSKVFLSG